LPDALVTIHDVEILKVGNWHSGLSGRVPITAEDIGSIVDAGQDAQVDQAPVKVGHVDPRFDGEPALGWLANLRNVGGTLVGDIVDAPAKMEALIRGAFRRRSAEVAWNVTTPGGKQYRAALQGLALLGVQVPAVKGLADVAARYSAPTSTSVDVVTIVDDDSSERSEAIAKALNVIAAGEASLALLSGSTDLHGLSSHTVRDDLSGTLEGATMKDDEVRAALGLPAEVPISDQLRKLAEAQVKAAADAEAAKAKADTDAAAQAAADQAKAQADADAKAAADLAASSPVTQIDRAALAELQALAAEGAQALTILNTQERERELEAAALSGRIVPASMDAYRALWDANKDQTKALLAGLPVAFSTVTSFSGAPATGADGKPLGEHGIPESDWDAFHASVFGKDLRPQ
jgi:hypothetical protein